MKRSYLFLFSFFGSLVAAAVLLLLLATILNSSPKSSSETVAAFTVNAGEGVSQIAHRLKEEKLIRSKNFFKFLCRVGKLQFSIQKGTYLIEGRLTSKQILSLMTSGKQMSAKCVIPEGFTVRQIAEKLFANNVIDDVDRFINAVNAFSLQNYGLNIVGAQGFLFPDSYIFQYQMNPNEIISTMTGNFFRKAEEENFLIDKQFYDRVILASVVEKEYRKEEEAPIIASVFLNRLQKRMRLESCATVLYVITEIQGKPHPSQLFYSDLEADSPYNTYRHAGLPPTPISNPGIVALHAAFNPAQTDYLFFVAKNDGSGRHIFTKDFYTHNYYKRHN